MRTAVNICVVLTCVIALANENSPAPISTTVDVRAEDLLVAGSKLGVGRAEIVAMLERSGFSV